MKKMFGKAKRILIASLVFIFALSLISPASASVGITIGTPINGSENVIYGNASNPSGGNALLLLQNQGADRFKVDRAGVITSYGDICANGGTKCLSTSASQWTTSGSNIYYNSGSVGIGTADATELANHKLVIAKDVTYPSDVTNSQLSLNGATTPGKQLSLGYDTNGNGFGFIAAGNRGVAWTNLSLQPSGGNVGIGNSSPTGLLQLGAGSFSATNGSYQEFHAGAFGALFRNNYDSYITGNTQYSASGWINKYANRSNIISMVDGNIEFDVGSGTTAGGASNLSPVMYIRNNGAVGIGNTAPGALLDVNGNAIVRGNDFRMNTANSATATFWLNNPSSGPASAGVYNIRSYDYWGSTLNFSSTGDNGNEVMNVNVQGALTAGGSFTAGGTVTAGQYLAANAYPGYGSGTGYIYYSGNNNWLRTDNNFYVGGTISEGGTALSSKYAAISGSSNYVVTYPGSSYSLDTLGTLGNSAGMDYASDGPVGGSNWYHYINLSYPYSSSNMWQSQLVIQPNTANTWVRGRASASGGSGGWTGWRQFIDTGNIGSQSVNYANSAGNADTTDGQHLGTGNGPTFNTVYTPNWFRSTGATGWYNETYGGGMYMQDSTWVRTYNSKNFYVDQQIRAARSINANGLDEAYAGAGGMNANYFHSATNDSWFSYPGNNYNYIRGNTYIGNENGIITTSGRIGIGTTDPSSYRIYGRDSNSSWAYRYDNTYNGSNIHVAHGGGYGLHVNAGTNANGSTYILELYSANGIGDNTKMMVMGDGSVGIGKANPSYTLDVVGDIYASDSLTTGGFIRSMGSIYSYGTLYSYGDIYATGGLTMPYGNVTTGDGTIQSNATGAYDAIRGISTSANQSGVYGRNTNGSGFAGYFYGRVMIEGAAYSSSGAWSGSDVRWKKNIVPLQGSLDKVLSLRGVNFDWNTKDYPEKNFKDGKQIGFIAQEVEKVVPEVVSTDENGYKSLSYDKLTAVLVEAVKELKKENEELKERVEVLEAGK